MKVTIEFEDYYVPTQTVKLPFLPPKGSIVGFRGTFIDRLGESVHEDFLVTESSVIFDANRKPHFSIKVIKHDGAE